MSKILLKVEDLRTYFFTRQGVVKAIDGVSFYVQEGETLGDKQRMLRGWPGWEKITWKGGGVV